MIWPDRQRPGVSFYSCLRALTREFGIADPEPGTKMMSIEGDGFLVSFDGCVKAADILKHHAQIAEVVGIPVIDANRMLEQLNTAFGMPGLKSDQAQEVQGVGIFRFGAEDPPAYLLRVHKLAGLLGGDCPRVEFGDG